MATKVNGKPAIEGIQFDLTSMTAREMQTFLKAARSDDYETLAETFTKVVTSFPLGDPSNPDTYLDLPYYTTDENPLSFTYLIQAMVEAGKNAASK